MTTINTIGRVTRDLELKTGANSGTVYVNFGLAVNKGFGKEQKTIFFECTAFGSVAERIVKAKVKKGSFISIVGEFDTEEYDRNDGNGMGYTLKVIIHAWSYIPRVNGNDSGNNGAGVNGNNNNAATYGGITQQHNQRMDSLPSGYDDGVLNLDDEDLPF